MKPRSIVFDLFGDYVRYRGGSVRLRTLATLMGCFGVGESTVRVAVARLRKEGWFDARHEGRESLYALNAKSLHLLDEGRARIFERVRGEWDRRWYMVIYSVPETQRTGVSTSARNWHGWVSARSPPPPSSARTTACSRSGKAWLTCRTCAWTCCAASPADCPWTVRWPPAAGISMN